MTGQKLLGEKALVDGVPSDRPATRARAAHSVTINMAESPLGWLLAHRHISHRQYDAGERLRADDERGTLGARVTRSWEGAPVAGRGGGYNPLPDLTGSQIDARHRFDAAVGVADFLWRVVCAGEDARGGKRARFAGQVGQAGVDPRARPRGGLLPGPGTGLSSRSGRRFP